MKIEKELKKQLNAEMLKLNFKHRTRNGIDDYINSAIQEGIELNGIEGSPFASDEDGRVYGVEFIGNETRAALVKMQETLGLSDVQSDVSATIDTNDQLYGIVPQYLTNELIERHPGTIPTLISMQRTDPNQILYRKGPSGTTLAYVDTAYMTVALNWATLMNWSFEILETRTDSIEDKVHISVLGRVTVHTTEGKTIMKEQWGSQVLKVKMEMGDGFKAASSDAMKKCTSMLGIAADVYAGRV